MIKSKFAIGNVYGTGVFLIAFLVGGIYFLLNPHMPVRNKFGTTTGAWLPGLVMVGAGLFLSYIFQKRIAFLRIYPDKLEIRSLFFGRTIYKQDITSIDVWGREDIGFMGRNRPVNAIVVTYGESEKYVLADMFYRNSAELKQALEENFIPGADAAPLFPENISGREPLPTGEEDEAEKFAGNAILSANGITLLACALVLFLLMPHHRHRDTDPWLLTWGLPMIILASFYFALGTQMCYFKVSDKYLVIRNQFLPWYKRSYMLDEIRDIVFENPAKRSNCLRVNTRDFSSKSFSAGSLRDDTWKALGKRLDKAGIAVRSEL